MFKYKYSTWRSRRFWRKINAIHSDTRRDMAYALGVKLQNKEEEYLRRINHIILADSQVQPTESEE